MKGGSKPDATRNLLANVDKTLTKGLQVLEALSLSDQPRGISEIALQLALTKSNVHRLLRTLVKAGYVAQDSRTERYFLSPKLWHLARPQRRYAALRNLIRPGLEELALETTESATFAVVERDEIVIVDQVESQHSDRVFFSVGQSLPINEVVLRGNDLTAFQMLTISTWPEDDARRVIEKIGRKLAKPPSFAEDRIKDLARVRANGFATSEGAWNPRVKAIAAPVYDRFGQLRGILLSFGPADRLGRNALLRLKAFTCAKAEEITSSLALG